MNYQTIKVRFQGSTCFIQFNRPEANNTINNVLINECMQVLKQCEELITVVVFEGLSDVFCFGADFQEMYDKASSQLPADNDPELLYDVWLKIATGPYITISHVRGKVNAGGVGFVAASDIVIANQTAVFSLSELLFGLYPACVLPFLIRRIGFQKAHYLTLMTRPISAEQACSWGLVDALEEKSETLVHKHLLRLRKLPKKGIMKYKSYMNQLNQNVLNSKQSALEANREMFADPRNLEGIFRFVNQGKFPWENERI